MRKLNYNEVKTAVGNAGILNRIRSLLPDKYCCDLTAEAMNEAVIDPTTLIVDIDPDTNEPFINPSEPQHFKNYYDAPRYDKIQLLKLQEFCSFDVKSPSTRRMFDARQLIIDRKLQREIDRFVSTELYKHPNLSLKDFTMHHIVGDLFFEIKKTSLLPGGETHSIILIAKNREIKDSTFLINAHIMLNIVTNIGNLIEIKKIFNEMKGPGAKNILDYINKFEKDATDYSTLSASRFRTFGSSNTANDLTTRISGQNNTPQT